MHESSQLISFQHCPGGEKAQPTEDVGVVTKGGGMKRQVEEQYWPVSIIHDRLSRLNIPCSHVPLHSFRGAFEVKHGFDSDLVPNKCWLYSINNTTAADATTTEKYRNVTRYVCPTEK